VNIVHSALESGLSSIAQCSIASSGVPAQTVKLPTVNRSARSEVCSPNSPFSTPESKEEADGSRWRTHHRERHHPEEWLQ
jgi:hypothetical protein